MQRGTFKILQHDFAQILLLFGFKVFTILALLISLLLLFEKIRGKKKKKKISTKQILKIKMCAEENICWVLLHGWIRDTTGYLRQKGLVLDLITYQNMLLRITSITDNRK